MARQAPIYSKDKDRDGLRRASRFNAQMMDHIRPYLQPGVTTGEIDRLVYGYTMEHGHTPACLGYQGYPKSICTSINEVVCHGIPGDRRLKDGDIVNVDLTTVVNGWYGDSSETFLIGEVSDEARRLVQVTFDAMWVGREFHQEPGVPHYPTPKSARDIVKPGVCFTIEPMLNLGVWRTVKDKADGWTVRTTDGKLSAQFEHTILMTDTGPEVLTLTETGPQEGHRF